MQNATPSSKRWVPGMDGTGAESQGECQAVSSDPRVKFGRWMAMMGEARGPKRQGLKSLALGPGAGARKTVQGCALGPRRDTFRA